VKEMSDQVRGIIFVILALIILFAFGKLYKPAVVPVPQTKSAQTAQPGVNGVGGVGNSAGPSTAGAAGGPAAMTASIPAANPGVVQASEEKTFVVSSPLYTVEISNRGGVVKTWKLNRYMNDQTPPQPLDLVNDSVAQQLGWPFSVVMAEPTLEASANTGLYEIETHAASTDVDAKTLKATSKLKPMPAGSVAAMMAMTSAADRTANAPTEVDMHWSDGHLDVTKKIKFDLNYEINVEVAAALDGKPLPVAIAWRGGFGDKAVYKAATLVTVYYNAAGKLNLLQYKKLGVSGNQAQPALQYGPLEYAGIEDQFFTAAFLPNGTDMSLWHWTQDHAGDPEAQMAAGSSTAGPVKLRMYVGPKDLGQLEALKPSLSELVNFGWMGPVAKPLLWVLQTLHSKVPNWGWCIVLMTLVINIAMFPLKMKSWRSMQKMQKVAPEIRQIQDRYKKYSMSDPRKKKMNEEVMAVYGREGINPMGSCLPMLFQMPIWWALWRVLNGAIELRHAPWMGWIHDLSAMDPYYILPIGMTIMMYLMTKMTPQTTVDPAQQKMMGLMPLFMGFIFFRLSSGLNLYMFTSNLVGVAQQYYLNKTEPLPSRSKFKKPATT
jgi:YidC/Oxa1 family membrane protein insertase